MNAWQHLEAPLRIASFLGLLLLLCLLEQRGSRRGHPLLPLRRLSNLALVVLDTVILRLCFPVLAVGYAAQVFEQGQGLFGLVKAPLWLNISLSILLLDLAIYWQHRWMHRIPALWRLHRVHHSDLRLDATSGFRFHPVEIVLSMAYKLVLIRCLGASPVGVLAFELILSCCALLVHADLDLPITWDLRLRRLLVTPAMHRIHHSILRHEADSNFGFSLSIWDRSFGSYCAASEQWRTPMQLGVHQFRRPREQTLWALLCQPLTLDTTEMTQARPALRDSAKD